MKKIFLSLLAVCSLLCANSFARGLSEHDYEHGLRLFKNKNYLAAREVFLKAEQQAPDNTAVLYNLGVVNYKLGFYPSARQYFLKLGNSEQYSAIAYYNLALIDFKLNSKESARNWLSKSLENNPPDGIKQLASQLLDKSDIENNNISVSKPNKPVIARKHINTLLKTSLGYNDNVTQYL
ncbi:MAG: tetratricopeptide repeat protein, partial [Gammaproteobacteria bacterium]|nr:tetratricopeptide repeat protein [Gammaproteobacteria bacterium]